MKINKKSKEGIKKKIALISLVALILNAAMIGVFAPLGNVLRAENNLCPVDVDVVLVMDRSGSMDAGTCEISGYEPYNNVTEVWCDSYGGSFDPNDDPSRLLQAKNAANLFLGNLGINDHSALVSYANTASPDKGLSNIHLDSDGSPSTQGAVDALVAEGGTNIGEAIAEGTAELSASGRADTTKAMILLTDGRPTCPIINPEYSTCGFIEDQGDIDYAKDKADLAAGLEYKIYTIGLGNDVNTDLLTYIAITTGAQYYPASDGDALGGIYNQISQELCHGSISGCKYEADIDGIMDDSNKLSEWEIVLNNGDADEIQLTIDGCYSFTNLPAGNYTMSEGENTDKQPYLQTWPLDLIYDNISLNGQSLDGFDFGNYFPVCGNGTVDTGYAGYTDEECDDGNTEDNDGCSAICLDEEEPPIYQCSDDLDNDDDDLIDEEDPGCHSDGNSDNPGSYVPTDDDEYDEQDPCGDGTCDTNIGENCSTCSQDCGSCGGGGGGVITKPIIVITNENVTYLGGGEAQVSWTTNIETTRQVAYGDDSVSIPGIAPEYGYDSVNGESLDMTKEHNVTISGLIDGVVYYFRPIADRSGSTGEKIGIEVFYELGEVKGVSDSPEPKPEPTPIPVECNYLLEYIKLGADNNSIEVEKLERFLNEFENEDLAVNGVYEQVDFDAVSRFQEKYLDQVLSPWSHDSSTGYVYITTKKRINELYCEREFPLTTEQANEVASFSSKFLSSSSEPSEETQDQDDQQPSQLPEDESGEVKGDKDEEPEESSDDEEEKQQVEENSETIESDDEKPRDEVLLIGENKDDETAEDGSIVRSFKDFNSWIWLIVIAIIGIVAYFLLFASKQKKGKGDGGEKTKI